MRQNAIFFTGSKKNAREIADLLGVRKVETPFSLKGLFGMEANTTHTIPLDTNPTKAETTALLESKGYKIGKSAIIGFTFLPRAQWYGLDVSMPS